MMKALNDIREMLCMELDEEAKKGELSAGSLETIHKITDTIKNIDKIMCLEEGGNSYDSGYGYGNGSYRGMSRRGGYSGNLMMDSGMEYGGGYSGRRYSRDDSKNMLKQRIEQMMNQGDMSGEDMNVLHRAMRILDKG